MNREIKFRAWDGLRMTFSGIMFNCTKGALEIPYGSQMKLMQYTGVKDKTGVEIYESDIVKTEVGIFAVEWNTELYSFQMGLNNAVIDQEVGCDISEVEVIGNIYENPEIKYQK